MSILDIGEQPAAVGSAEGAVAWSPSTWVGDADDMGYVVDWQIDSDDSGSLMLPPTENEW